MRKQWDDEFGKIIPPLSKEEDSTKGKDKGRLFILSEWHKEGKEKPSGQRVFPSISFPLCFDIFSSSPLPER